ncbi:MAG: hypothetical protein NZ551_04185 [Microscillaceae bacterium]|nr:hypothetical protein [Microscillaceae bacterium]MDW8460390.1 hypothetical protein [Cytophagales bacterium]
MKENRKSYLVYSILAEAYALLGDTKNFYETLETALQNGFPLHENLDEPAYERYIHQEEFQALLKRYLPAQKSDTLPKVEEVIPDKAE